MHQPMVPTLAPEAFLFNHSSPACSTWSPHASSFAFHQLDRLGGRGRDFPLVEVDRQAR